MKTKRIAFALPAAVLLITVSVAASQAKAADSVYVPMGSGGEILVIDASRDTVTGKIVDVPDIHGLARSPDGLYLVAGSYAETSAAAAPPKPEEMPEDEHAAHHAKATDESTAGFDRVSFLSVIRTDDGSIVRRIEVPGAVHHVAVTPDGRYAIATHPNAGGISVSDLDNFLPATALQTGPMPNYVVTSPDGRWLYVSNAGNDTVSEIDTERWTVRRTFAVGGSPEHMVVSADGARLYVNNVDDGTVSVVALAEAAVVDTYTVGGGLHGIDLSDDGRSLFVSGLEEDKLAAIDLESGRLRVVPLAASPYHLTTIRGTGKLYVSSAEEPRVWVVDQETLSVLGEIMVGGKAHQMVVGWN